MSTATDFFRRMQDSAERLLGRPQKEQTIVVREREVIPCDGEVIDGCAKVDEAAVTGVSQAAILSAESGRNRTIKGGVVLEGSLTIKFFLQQLDTKRS